MGVPQFLAEILPAAGRKVDLRNYKGQGIPLRIGVDVATWIHKAAYGFGDKLGDERHLTNYGRATLHYQNTNNNAADDASSELPRPVNPAPYNEEQVQKYVTACAKYVVERLLTLQRTTEAEILVVLDGATPPIKRQEVNDRSDKWKQAEKERDKPVDIKGGKQAEEQRVKANKRAGAGKHFSTIVDQIILDLRSNSIPFLVAPYEADGQLAYLALSGYLDLIITEDSDLVAYGASPILYKFSDSMKDGIPGGILVRSEDLAAVGSKYDLMDFSPVMLAVMFVAAGSDYCKKLKGIGIVTACNIVHSAFLSKRSQGQSPLSLVIKQLFEMTRDKNITKEEEVEYKRNFLSALLMFRHPVVYDPIKGACVTVGNPDEKGGDPELVAFRPYAKLCQNPGSRAHVTGPPLPSPLVTHMAEGWISPKTMRPRPGIVLPAYVRSDLEHHLGPRNYAAEELETQDMDVDIEGEIGGDEDREGEAGADDAGPVLPKNRCHPRQGLAGKEVLSKTYAGLSSELAAVDIAS